jgi:hypothetical protein
MLPGRSVQKFPYLIYETEWDISVASISNVALRSSTFKESLGESRKFYSNQILPT